MWLTVFKGLLVTFLLVSAVFIVVVGVRRSRANGGDSRWSQPQQGQPGYLASIRGVMPKTPQPREDTGFDDRNPSS
jgi:hypothetical protein